VHVFVSVFHSCFHFLLLLCRTVFYLFCFLLHFAVLIPMFFKLDLFFLFLQSPPTLHSSVLFSCSCCSGSLISVLCCAVCICIVTNINLHLTVWIEFLNDLYLEVFWCKFPQFPCYLYFPYISCITVPSLHHLHPHLQCRPFTSLTLHPFIESDACIGGDCTPCYFGLPTPDQYCHAAGVVELWCWSFVLGMLACE